VLLHSIGNCDAGGLENGVVIDSMEVVQALYFSLDSMEVFG
jgi:hypothetical protein